MKFKHHRFSSCVLSPERARAEVCAVEENYLWGGILTKHVVIHQYKNEGRSRVFTLMALTWGLQQGSQNQVNGLKGVKKLLKVNFHDGECRRYVRRVSSWPMKRGMKSVIRGHNFTLQISVLRVGSKGPCLWITAHKCMKVAPPGYLLVWFRKKVWRGMLC